MPRILLYIAVIFLSLVSTVSCIEEDYTYDVEHKVTFSIDTVCFDTLFSENASYTRTILVKNDNKCAIKFSTVKLGGGINSNFRFNIDGRIPNEKSEAYDVTVLGKDSIYVFIETTVPEDTSNLDLLILDSLQFYYNGNVSQVQLQAVGKNAILFEDYSVRAGERLKADRPYLIMGYLHVPAGETLIVEAGTKMYFHTGSHLIVDGNIEMRGTIDNPVLMRGSRFDNVNDADDTPYYELPSQWGNVYLQNSAGKHLLEHVNINGASLGVLLIGSSRAMPELTVNNSVIHNIGGYGIYSQNGKVRVSNTEISNCGSSCVFQLGGEMEIVHSTIANYFKFGSRTTPACYIANYAKQNMSTLYFPISSTVIENSIVFGQNSTEIMLYNDTVNNTEFNVFINNNLLKAKKDDSLWYRDNIWAYSQNGMGRDTVFASIRSDEDGYFDFRLDTLSHAISRANIDIATRYPLDLKGKSRLADGAPDLGAYER